MTQAPITILGIDPGSRITGYGILSVEKERIACLAGGCFRLEGKTHFHRLKQLFDSLKGLVQTYQPHEVAIEQVFVHKNPNSALKLGQARGVAISAVMMKNVLIFEYAPRAIKQSVVGRGSAEKAQVQHMIKVLLKLPDLPQQDAADALAIALCHAHTRQSPLAERDPFFCYD